MWKQALHFGGGYIKGHKGNVDTRIQILVAMALARGWVGSPTLDSPYIGSFKLLGSGVPYIECKQSNDSPDLPNNNKKFNTKIISLS